MAKENKFLTNIIIQFCRTVLVLVFLTSGATRVFAQLEKKVTLEVVNEPLSQVLTKIEDLSGYKVLFTYDEIQQYRVSVNLNNQTVRAAMRRVLSDIPMEFTIKGKFITVFSSNRPFQKNGVVGADSSRIVKGVVRDADGEPLMGVPVSIGDGRISTVTDAEGAYTLSISQEQTVLKYTYVGMRTTYMTIPQGSQQVTRDVVMHSDTHLDEVIATGYRTISKERATGSFGTIGSRQLEGKLNSNLKNIIEGQVPGMVLDKDGNIYIRGLSTLTAEENPLIVVDGYPTEGSLSDLNPNNIENITVLKDGVASSIYGSRAANGVIVVTTKSGRQQKPTLSYKGTFRFESRPDLSYLHQSSTSDFIDAELALYELSPTSSAYSLSYKNAYTSDVTYLLAQRKAGLISDSQFDQQINALRQVDGLAEIEKNMFRTAFTQTHNVGLNGGMERYRYNLAANYTSNRSSFINTHDNRLLIDFKNEWQPYKFLEIGFSANINYGHAKAPNTGWKTYTDFTNYYKPYHRLKTENGELTELRTISYGMEQLYQQYSGLKETTYNPIRDSYDSYNTTHSFSTRLSGFLRAKVWQGLSVEFGGNWTKGNSIYKAIHGANSYMLRLAYNNSTSIKTPSNHYVPDGDMIGESRYNNENWTLRTQINYDWSYGKHRVNALVGNEVRRITRDDNTYETRLGYNPTAGSFTPINIKDFKGGSYNQDMLNGNTLAPYVAYGRYSYVDNRFVSWYFNGSYEIDDRYLISGSIREDLTNFFGTDPKYRYKPLWSMGGTWKIANEKFFNVEWIDRLNLRASYGINGNISLSQGPYLILSAGSYTSVTDGVSYGISSYPNKSLRWEKTRTTNMGVDINTFRNRLMLSFDYYRKNSSDLLASDALDPTSGASSIVKNVGEILNRGYEISIQGTPVLTRRFRWDITYNVSFNHSEVKEYNVARNYPTAWAWTSPVHAKGYPMYGLFGYKFAGLNDKGQTMIYKADGTTALASTVTVDDIVYQGTTVPKTDMSLTNHFSYKNWDLSFMLIAKLGHVFRKDVFQGSNYTSRYFNQRWQKPGDEATTIYPVFRSWNMDMFYFPFCDVNIADADYAKLRDVTLSYYFSKQPIQKIGLSSARVYLQVRNLFRITANDIKVDPETFENNYGGGMGSSSNAGYSLLPTQPEYFIGVSFAL